MHDSAPNRHRGFPKTRQSAVFGVAFLVMLVVGSGLSSAVPAPAPGPASLSSVGSVSVQWTLNGFAVSDNMTRGSGFQNSTHGSFRLTEVITQSNLSHGEISLFVDRSVDGYLGLGSCSLNQSSPVNCSGPNYAANTSVAVFQRLETNLTMTPNSSVPGTPGQDPAWGVDYARFSGHEGFWLNSSGPEVNGTSQVRLLWNASSHASGSISFLPALGDLPDQPSDNTSWISSANFTEASAGGFFEAWQPYGLGLTGVAGGWGGPLLPSSGSVKLYQRDLGPSPQLGNASAYSLQTIPSNPLELFDNLADFSNSTDLFSSGPITNPSIPVSLRTNFIDFEPGLSSHLGIIAASDTLSIQNVTLIVYHPATGSAGLGVDRTPYSFVSVASSCSALGGVGCLVRPMPPSNPMEPAPGDWTNSRVALPALFASAAAIGLSLGVWVARRQPPQRLPRHGWFGTETKENLPRSLQGPPEGHASANRPLQ